MYNGIEEAEDPLAEELQQALNLQRTKFQTQYAKDPEFKKRVEQYSEARIGYFKKLSTENIKEDDFKAIWDIARKDLARRLLIIYGHANESGLTPDFKKAIRPAGEAYAYASWWINSFNYAPGIARSVALLGPQMARQFFSEDDPTQTTIGYVEGVIFACYGLWQLAATVYGPFRQAAMQDIDVARQVALGPTHIPDVSPEMIYIEHGKPQPVRKKSEIQEMLDDITKDGVVIWGLDDILHGEDEEFKPFINKEKASKKTHNEGLWEKYRLALYEQMDVNDRQSRNRGYRATWNTASSLVSLASASASVAKSPSWITPTLTSLGLIPLVGQPAQYKNDHPKLAGEDYAKKIVTLFEISAMTGLGDLRDKDTKKIVPARLDQMIKCRMLLRLDYARKVLQFDADIYLCAIIGHLLDDVRAKGDNDAQFIETRKSFLKCSLAERRTRINQVKNPAGRHLLNTYEEMIDAVNCLKQGNVSPLLKGDERLGSRFRNILAGSLRCAAGGEITDEDRKCDESLIKAKGDALRLSDLSSSHQTAQKWGQSASYVVFGSAGFNIIKMIYSFARSGILYSDPGSANEYLKGWSSTLAFAQGGLQLISSYFAWQTGYSQHKNIALKNYFRGRDADKHSIPNQGALTRDYLFNIRGTIKDFTTLLYPEIKKDDLPADIRYEIQTSTASDIWQQMKVASLKKALCGKYLWAESGSKKPQLDPEAEQVMELGQSTLEAFYKDFARLEIAERLEKLMHLTDEAQESEERDRADVELLVSIGRMLNLKLKPRNQPWNPAKTNQLRGEIEKLNAELQEKITVLEETIYLNVCVSFDEYVRCKSNKFDPARLDACFKEAKNMKVKSEDWEMALSGLVSKYKLKRPPQHKKKPAKAVASLDDYLKTLITAGLDSSIFDEIKELAGQKFMKAEELGAAIEFLNKQVSKRRHSTEFQLIQTLNASDELTDPAAVILKVISKRFAYPKGKTFAKFADEFAAITKKNANAVAAMAVAVDLEPDTLEMGVSPPTNESAKPKKKRKKLREGRTRAILEDSDVDECGHPI